MADSIFNLKKAVTFQAPFSKPALFGKADQAEYIQTQDLMPITAMFFKHTLDRIKHAGY